MHLFRMQKKAERDVVMKTEVIELSSLEIREIIAEKYGVNPSLDVVITCERRVVNYNSVDARVVYEPTAMVYIPRGKEE